MHPTEIESILRAALALDELYVQGENGHYKVIAVSSLFAGMSRVKKTANRLCSAEGTYCQQCHPRPEYQGVHSGRVAT